MIFGSFGFSWRALSIASSACEKARGQWITVFCALPFLMISPLLRPLSTGARRATSPSQEQLLPLFAPQSLHVEMGVLDAYGWWAVGLSAAQAVSAHKLQKSCCMVKKKKNFLSVCYRTWHLWRDGILRMSPLDTGILQPWYLSQAGVALVVILTWCGNQWFFAVLLSVTCYLAFCTLAVSVACTKINKQHWLDVFQLIQMFFSVWRVHVC